MLHACIGGARCLTEICPASQRSRAQDQTHAEKLRDLWALERAEAANFQIAECHRAPRSDSVKRALESEVGSPARKAARSELKQQLLLQLQLSAPPQLSRPTTRPWLRRSTTQMHMHPLLAYLRSIQAWVHHLHDIRRIRSAPTIFWETTINTPLIAHTYQSQ